MTQLRPIDPTVPDQDEPATPFQAWEDDRDDGTNFFRGVINGLCITALFAAVFAAAWVMTP